jgi:hypothetical protein
MGEDGTRRKEGNAVSASWKIMWQLWWMVDDELMHVAKLGWCYQPSLGCCDDKEAKNQKARFRPKIVPSVIPSYLGGCYG